MVDQAGLQNLRLQDVIVTPGGTPTQYFMRLLQGKTTNSADVQAQIDAILAALAGKADKIIVLTAGTGLTGGGNLSADRSFAIDTAAEAERIRDVIGTALVAGTNITITVDDPGDTITIAASGGGGGGAPWWLQPPTAASLSLTTTSGSNLNLTDDADAGLLFIDPTNAADTRRAAYRTLTTPTGDFDFQVFIQSILVGTDFQGIGLWAQASGSGREYWWGAHSNVPFGILRMTGITFSSVAYNVTPRIVSSGMFLRMVKSGATFSFYYSGNGKQWQLAFSEGTGAWTGNVDRVGIFTRCSFATTSPDGVGGACPLFLLTGTAV